jgi:uncharacterized membrane protein
MEQHPPKTPTDTRLRRLAQQYRATLEILWLYVLMIAGGLWHILGVLQTAMNLLSVPMIAAIAAWSVWNTRKTLLAQGASRSEQMWLYAWCGGVFVLGFAVEFVGVKTGLIFGDYTYDTAPFPALMPLAIGSAWLGTMLASTALAQRLFVVAARFSAKRPAKRLAYHFGDSALTSAAAVGVLMALFDGCMEPAATALHYWAWKHPYSSASFLVAPLQNYAAWFGVSVVFSFVGLKIGVCKRVLPSFVVHSYWAQLMYFVMVNFR